MRYLKDAGAWSKAGGFALPTWLLVAACALGLIGAPAALADAAGPHWRIVSQADPTHFQAGSANDAYRLIVRNDGAGATESGGEVSVTDTLPAGVIATKISLRAQGPNGSGSPRYEFTCSELPAGGVVSCTYKEPLPVLAGATIMLTITVSIPSEVSSLEPNVVTVSGGGAPSATLREPSPLQGGPVPFDLAFFDSDLTDESGSADTQAGSHPFELTASLAFDIPAREAGGAKAPLASASLKDLEVQLPPGLVGDPNAVPRCSQQEFQSREDLDCPLDTQVGTIKPYFYGSFPSSVFPLYNIVPPAGEPGELGFTVAGIGHVPIFLHVRSNSDYGLTAQLRDIPEVGPLQGAIVTLWGLPADGSHDFEREGTTGEGSQQEREFCKPSIEANGEGREEETRCPSGLAAKPFLTMPSSCQASGLPVSVRRDSWQEPEAPPNLLEPEPPGSFLAETPLPALSGCERLSFDPSLAVQPETEQAGAPSGYTLDIHVPQDEDPTGLASPDLRSAVVALPPGAVLSPAVGFGLQACSEEQFALKSLAPASCPAASTIGTVRIATPPLSSPLEGQLFLARPDCEPCDPADAQEGRMIRLFVQAQGSGVIVKLQGSASVDQSTGGLTVSFAEDRQWPLEDVKLTLDGGPRAALADGFNCGTPLSATAQLTPYSEETPAARSSAPFQLTGCPTPQFSPSFVAGAINNQAGAFSPVTITISRSNQDEDLRRIALRLPPGLLGMLSSVGLCAEAQAQAGTCGAQSQIGTVTVGVGPGPDPLFLKGQAYLTGPYSGAPFGLAIVVPAVVGPLHLGVVDIRAAVGLEESTGALQVTSDPLPQSLDGIPLQIGTLSLDIERERFAFNPTNCRAMSVEGGLESASGSGATVSSPFEAADCATLAFKPKLTALTHARSSRTGGVYLHVKLASGHGQANIAKLKLDLPKQFASRLTTLSKACPAALVQTDPGGCPAASVVGIATAVTPVLANALTGPVYIVSHGAGALPALELVLQGEGVVLDLLGETSVAHGILESAFRSLPDVPLSSFDLVLGEGPHSILAANLPRSARGSMCSQSLAMPIELTGQNGAVLKQTTKIAVSSCPRHARRAPRGRTLDSTPPRVPERKDANS